MSVRYRCCDALTHFVLSFFLFLNPPASSVLLPCLSTPSLSASRRETRADRDSLARRLASAEALLSKSQARCGALKAQLDAARASPQQQGPAVRANAQQAAARSAIGLAKVGGRREGRQASSGEPAGKEGAGGRAETPRRQASDLTLMPLTSEVTRGALMRRCVRGMCRRLPRSSAVGLERNLWGMFAEKLR